MTVQRNAKNVQSDESWTLKLNIVPVKMTLILSNALHLIKSSLIVQGIEWKLEAIWE
jgi:hypothetical protein